MNQKTKYHWLIFYKDQLLLEKKEGTFRVFCSEQPPIPVPEETVIHTLNAPERITYKIFFVNKPIEETPRQGSIGLRASYEILPLSQYQAAGKAYQMLHWEQHSRFCPACGTHMERSKEPIMKECPECGHQTYPVISTAILVLVRKEDTILLVHARNFKGTFYSLVAGFLETGETLEECVAREVKEETGLEVDHITYFGNQPWPYPSGLMVGFIADYAGGDIKLQDEELSAGAFYTRENLPELPGKLSLARKMIDWWMEGK